MTDTRHRDLARVLVRHSTQTQPGQHILIETWDTPETMIEALLAEIRAAGGHPPLVLRSSRLMPALVGGAAEEAAPRLGRVRPAPHGADGRLHRDPRQRTTSSEMAGVGTEGMKAFGSLYQKPVHFEQRVNHTRWCVLRWPNPSMAQLAGMIDRRLRGLLLRRLHARLRRAWPRR